MNKHGCRLDCSTLYQINPRVWLEELSRELKHPVTLDGIFDSELDRIAASGFDWIWLVGVWQTGAAGRSIAIAHSQLRDEYKKTVADFTDEDVCGSPFAIKDYSVDISLGGNNAFQSLRQRLKDRGIRLMLDFVPNHTATDHAWAYEHPEYYVHGSQDDLQRKPDDYCGVNTKDGFQILAHGREPYSSAWTDNLQLD